MKPKPTQPQDKHALLLQKKQEAEEKLKHLYLNFRGVRHESSSDELKYTQIKVLESYIESIEAELKSLGFISDQKEGEKI